MISLLRPLERLRRRASTLDTVDLVPLYRQMARVRAFEETQAALWNDGSISGEMHLTTGEEAVSAGVCAHLRRGDAALLDHRPTGVLTALGVDPASMLAEMMGRAHGLNGGWAGQMHMMAKEHLAAASGIVGSAGPLAAGFALAATRLRPGSVAVAFFGDGAMNQGMLLESFNLAAVWRLPMVFVCKDNGWAISTRTEKVSAGDFRRRAEGFGLPAFDVDGLDVGDVSTHAEHAVSRARDGGGPTFLRARCSRLDGHFLGDPLVRAAKKPNADDKKRMKPVIAALLDGDGAGPLSRARSVLSMIDLARHARKSRRDSDDDPMTLARRRLDAEIANRLENDADREMRAAVETAMGKELAS